MMIKVFGLIVSIAIFLFTITLYIDSDNISTSIIEVILTIQIVVYISHELYKDISTERQKNKENEIVNNKILENLISDQEKLNTLIPLLKEDSHENGIDKKYELNSSDEYLISHIHTLYETDISKIQNKERIDKIILWVNNKTAINKQLSQYSRVDFINTKESEIVDSLGDVIRLFTNNA